MQIERFLNFFIFLSLIQISISLKQVEKCIHKVLNSKDDQFKFLADYEDIQRAILQYPLLPKDVQDQLQKCKVDNEEKIKCEENGDICEECGMVYVKKCPQNYKRFDCGICVRNCPKLTTIEYNGSLCKKPKIIHKKIYKNIYECKKENDNCLSYKKFVTNTCPEHFKPLGQYLCTYDCGDEYKDSRLYCQPDMIKNNEYFSSSLTNKYAEQITNEY